MFPGAHKHHALWYDISEHAEGWADRAHTRRAPYFYLELAFNNRAVDVVNLRTGYPPC